MVGAEGRMEDALLEDMEEDMEGMEMTILGVEEEEEEGTEEVIPKGPEEEEKERQEDEREEKTSDTEWGPPAEI